jgi:hypothetical protein
VTAAAVTPTVTPPAAKRPAAKPPAAKQPAAPANSFKLSITSTPSATLYVDGRRIGVTPISGYTLSNRGRRFLRLEREGYQTQRDMIDARRAPTVRRNYVLQRKPK